LSKGVTTTATITHGPEALVITSVNGDKTYDARTTRRAVQLLFEGHHKDAGRVALEQNVDTPIGAGFGASGASATSAVFAAASAGGIVGTAADIALFAHRAEIIEQTGLGTVSVVFDAVGAGAITAAGEPGKAKFVNVKVPDGARLVTACVAPYDKKSVLSSKSLNDRIGRFGREALESFLSDPTFDALVQEGERFSKRLGLESPEVMKLISLARSAGATGASQNMIGYSMHSIANEDSSGRVARALAGLSPAVRVDTFEIGARRAGVLPASRRSQGPS